MKPKHFFFLLFILLVLFFPLIKAECSDHLKQESDHFIYIYYHEKEPINDIKNILEENYIELVNNYNIDIEEKIVVEIFPDLKSFHENINIIYDDNVWAVGKMINSKKIAFVSPLNPGPAHNYKSIIKIALHEFVHIITWRINKSTPIWLAEGIAVYETNQYKKHQVKYLVRLGKIPSLNELEKDFMNNEGYVFSGSIIEYILYKYSYNHLVNLIKNPNDYEKVLGVTKKIFFENWKNYLKDIINS